MKYGKIISLILSAALTAGMLGACGDPADRSGTSSVSSSSGGADKAGAEENASSKAYLSAALEMIRTAKEICGSGAGAAEKLAQATDDLYNLSVDETYTPVTGITDENSYIMYSEGLLRDLSGEREKLSDLETKLDQVSVPGDEVLGAIKSALADTLHQADASFSDMEQLVAFFGDSNESYSRILAGVTDNFDESDSQAYIGNICSALRDLQSEYRSMNTPPQLKEIWDRNADNISLFSASMNYISNYDLTDGASIYYYCFREMNDYNSAVETSYTRQLLQVISDSYKQDHTILGKTCRDNLEKLGKSCENNTVPETNVSPEPVFRFEITDKIYPNRYPSMDSVINLSAATNVPEQDVIISAEITGFTQGYEQKVTLSPQISYFMIKPPLLTDLPDLSTKRDTQIIFKITDNETGKILVEESRNLTLYSIYDFFMETDEFGSASVFDLLGWLRPESDAVDLVNRQAVSYLESVTGEGMLTGYTLSYSETPDINTMVQVAAIQKAISDIGIRYTMDPYSFSGAQHILTPDQVVAKKTGLCIESSLLMASCLMKAGLHPVIILVPGHAQVAVESDENSGIYYLVETTNIPYEGFSFSEDGLDHNELVLNASDPSSSWWNEYLASAENEEGFPFIIDCDLRSVMQIQGLENVQAAIDIDPVEYENVDIPVNADGTAEDTGSDPGEDASLEYTTATNADGDLTIIVKSDAEVSLTDNYITVCPIAGAGVPVMNVVRVYNTDADTYLSGWIDSLEKSGYAVSIPTETSTGEFDSLTYELIAYYTAGDDGTYYQNVVAVTAQDDGSLIVFELIAEDGTDNDIDALNEAFATALYTFT